MCHIGHYGIGIMVILALGILALGIMTLDFMSWHPFLGICSFQKMCSDDKLSV